MPAGNQSCKVGNVRHGIGADGARDLADSFEVDDSRISARSTDDQSRFGLARQLFELIVVDSLGVFFHTVRLDVVYPAREIQRVPMCQMSAVGQIHPENRISRLTDSHVDSNIGLRSGMRLGVDMFGAKELFGTFTHQGLHNIYKLTTRIVSPSRVTFRILVRQYRTGRLQDRLADEVLRGNEF